MEEMLQMLKIALIFLLVAPDLCSAKPHDLSYDYGDNYYTSKEEEFKAMKYEFSEHVEHLKSGQALIAAGIACKQCIFAARSELDGKHSKCLNPFEMKLGNGKAEKGATPVWQSEKFCYLLHTYQNCLVATICRHCLDPKVAAMEKHQLDMKKVTCEMERARRFSICTDPVERQKRRRFWANISMALFLSAALLLYFGYVYLSACKPCF